MLVSIQRVVPPSTDEQHPSQTGAGQVLSDKGKTPPLPICCPDLVLDPLTSHSPVHPTVESLPFWSPQTVRQHRLYGPYLRSTARPDSLLDSLLMLRHSDWMHP